jgi:hypothetical protein
VKTTQRLQGQDQRFLSPLALNRRGKSGDNRHSYSILPRKVRETAPLETVPLETVPLETVPLETAPLETGSLETGSLALAFRFAQGEERSTRVRGLRCALAVKEGRFTGYST